MQSRVWTMVCLCAVGGVANILLVTAGRSEEAAKTSQAKTSQKGELDKRVTVAEARGRARLLHDVYESTLHVVHRTYFEEGKRITIPARALEDVFSLVDRETKGTTRWIAVNAEAMSVHHKPRDEFEKKAARALASGKEEFEQVDGGSYRRAGAITLFASCLRCHESALGRQTAGSRVAGLVINIPIKKE